MSKDKIVSLKEITNKPCEHTITLVEDLLKAAKSGEIVGLVLACQHGDGLTSHMSAGVLDWKPNSMVGVLENAKLNYQLNHALEYIPK